MWPSPPFFLPRRFFAVSISARRSFSSLLLYSSSHRVRLVDVTRCSTHRRPMRPDGELVSEGDLWSLMCVLSGGLVSRKRCRESVQSDSEFVQFGVGLRKIKDAGW